MSVFFAIINAMNNEVLDHADEARFGAMIVHSTGQLQQ
jgi:hypothetical protein